MICVAATALTFLLVPTEGGTEGGGYWAPMYTGDELTVSVEIAGDSRGILLKRRALVPGGTAFDWVDIISRHSVSFEVTAVAPAIGEVLFVSGESLRNGDQIIERWEFQVPVGGRGVTGSAPSAPIGSPQVLGGTGASSGVQGGGGYVPPSSRAPVTVSRTEVWRGAFPPISRMEADPNERYVVFTTEVGGIYQLALEPTAVPTSIADPVAAATIALRPELDVYEANNLGRVLVAAFVESGSEASYALWWDYNNDGAFEHVESFGYLGWFDQGYAPFVFPWANFVYYRTPSSQLSELYAGD